MLYTVSLEITINNNNYTCILFANSNEVLLRLLQEISEIKSNQATYLTTLLAEAHVTETAAGSVAKMIRAMWVAETNHGNGTESIWRR